MITKNPALIERIEAAIKTGVSRTVAATRVKSPGGQKITKSEVTRIIDGIASSLLALAEPEAEPEPKARKPRAKPEAAPVEPTEPPVSEV